MPPPFFAGRALIIEFIFMQAMTLKCHPLQPERLLAMKSLFADPERPDQHWKILKSQHYYSPFPP
ncbi:MAG TPA: hypothetical protein VIC26_09680 [Marinagarivorans sp.]